MIKCFNVVQIGFFAMLIVLSTGCSKTPKPDGFPEVYPCAISIVQDDQPLSGASVMLVPETNGERNWVVSGGTDANGVARLYTHGKYPGAPAGKYKVTVSKLLVEGELPSDKPVSPSASVPTPKSYDLVDTLYKNARTTPFEIEIGSQKNAQMFDVGKAVRLLIPER